MNQREKLIELFLQFAPWGDEYAKNLADYLIDNGVVVLPCKMGDKVWSISNKICKEKLRHCNHCYDCNGTEFWNNCFRANDAPFSVEFEYDMIEEIGKTIFLTKEEAKRALKERWCEWANSCEHREYSLFGE